MIKVAFTTSDKLLAKLIRWATEEECSHCVLVWDDVVVHSNWKGVNVIHLTEFLNENRILHEIQVKEDLDALTRAIVQKDQSLYDVGALLFLGIVLFSRRILGLRKWPKKNLWQSSGMYLCTEFVTEFIDGKADSLITPHKLFERMSVK